MLAVLRNISDSTLGQEAILCADGIASILQTLRQHAGHDEVVELSLECLHNVCATSLQNTLSLVLEVRGAAAAAVDCVGGGSGDGS